MKKRVLFTFVFTVLSCLVATGYCYSLYNASIGHGKNVWGGSYYYAYGTTNPYSKAERVCSAAYVSVGNDSTDWAWSCGDDTSSSKTAYSNLLEYSCGSTVSGESYHYVKFNGTGYNEYWPM